MGTASTMAILCEVLGLMVAGSASDPCRGETWPVAARQAGRLAVSAVLADLRPQSVLSPDSFVNAIVALNAVAGSTNAVIHLAAMAGRAGLPFPLEDIARLGAAVPVLADIQPSGAGPDAGLRRGGGVPALLRELAGDLRPGARTVGGGTIGDVIATAGRATGAIRPATAPLREGGAFGVVGARWRRTAP